MGVSILVFFGHDCDAPAITAGDQIAFVRKRLAGQFFLVTSEDGSERLSRCVRPLSARADIEVFSAMPRWATIHRPRLGLLARALKTPQ